MQALLKSLRSLNCPLNRSSRPLLIQLVGLLISTRRTREGDTTRGAEADFEEEEAARADPESSSMPAAHNQRGRSVGSRLVDRLVQCLFDGWLVGWQVRASLRTRTDLGEEFVEVATVRCTRQTHDKHTRLHSFRALLRTWSGSL